MCRGEIDLSQACLPSHLYYQSVYNILDRTCKSIVLARPDGCDIKQTASTYYGWWMVYDNYILLQLHVCLAKVKIL